VISVQPFVIVVHIWREASMPQSAEFLSLFGQVSRRRRVAGLLGAKEGDAVDLYISLGGSVKEGNTVGGVLRLHNRYNWYRYNRYRCTCTTCIAGTCVLIGL
jgi:hypothetical protein